MRFFLLVLGMVGCCILLPGGSRLLANPASLPATLPADTVVVTVNDVPILERDVIVEADHQINMTMGHSAKRGFIYDEASRPQTRAAIRDDVIHTLIERELIQQQLRADGIVITDAEVDAEFMARAKKFGQTRAEAEQEIIDQGQTPQDVRMRLRWHTLGVKKLYELHATNKKDLSEAEAKKVYDDAPNDFAQEQERRVSRILINASQDFDAAYRKAALARAQALLKRIQEGEDFAKVAKEASEDVDTKADGGDRGWSGRGRGGPGSDAFGDAAFALKKVGDVSGVVETIDGYEIIKLTGLKEARQKTFDEVKNQIIERDKFLEIGNFWQAYADSLNAHAHIKWNPVELARQEQEAKEAKAMEPPEASSQPTTNP